MIDSPVISCRVNAQNEEEKGFQHPSPPLIYIITTPIKTISYLMYCTFDLSLGVVFGISFLYPITMQYKGL